MCFDRRLNMVSKAAGFVFTYKSVEHNLNEWWHAVVAYACKPYWDF